MRILISSLFIAASLLVLTGCKTAPTEAQLAIIHTVAEESAYVGASYAIQENPNLRNRFILAADALGVLVKRGNVTPAELQQSLAGLPALRGASGALIEGATLLYTLAAGFLPVDSAPRATAASSGVYDGLKRATVRVVGRGSAAIQTLPKQCTVPTH